MIYKRTITDSIYGVSIHVMVCEFVEFREFFVQEFSVEMSARVPEARVTEHSFSLPNGKKITDWYFWMPPWPRTLHNRHYGTITHETFHLTAQILRSRGLWLVEGSEEAFAYYLSNLFSEVLHVVQGYDAWYQQQVALRKKQKKRR